MRGPERSYCRFSGSLIIYYGNTVSTAAAGRLHNLGGKHPSDHRWRRSTSSSPRSHAPVFLFVIIAIFSELLYISIIIFYLKAKHVPATITADFRGLPIARFVRQLSICQASIRTNLKCPVPWISFALHHKTPLQQYTDIKCFLIPTR